MDGQKYFANYSDLAEHKGVKELAEHAKLLGIQFKIDGFPFGSDYDAHCKTFGLIPRGESNGQAGEAQFPLN